MTYTAKTFNLPALKGLSEKQIKVHLALYEGYVKHVNLIAEKLAAVREKKLELDPYITAELRRRFAFEFDGMRMHELYFAQLAAGSRKQEAGSPLSNAVRGKYGEKGLEEHVREVTGSRGIGWGGVYAGPVAKTIHTVFVGDREQGQLAG